MLDVLAFAAPLLCVAAAIAIRRAAHARRQRATVQWCRTLLRNTRLLNETRHTYRWN